LSHLKDLAIYRRGIQITSGNALVARLAKTVFDLRIPVLTDTAAHSLVVEGGAVRGALVQDQQGEFRIGVRRAVVLACGRFAHDIARVARAYPHVVRGSEHFSPTPSANTGDGNGMAEDVGGTCEIRFPSSAAWMPISGVPTGRGKFALFPRLVDRYKPGVIAVNRRGKRFSNESNSYHGVGVAMIADAGDEPETTAWPICDHTTVQKYGIGYAKPAPVPVGGYVRTGCLLTDRRVRGLAKIAGIDPDGLEQTVRYFDTGAAVGEDPQFGRGATAFNRVFGDAEHTPNPNVAPIVNAPFYALKLWMGDLRTFDELTTDSVGRLIGAGANPILGLYAVGNDRASAMGGNSGAGVMLAPIMTLGSVTGRHLAALSD
jgi:hypothetical protein